jgi:hypothetical protein
MAAQDIQLSLKYCTNFIVWISFEKARISTPPTILILELVHLKILKNNSSRISVRLTPLYLPAISSHKLMLKRQVIVLRTFDNSSCAQQTQVCIHLFGQAILLMSSQTSIVSTNVKTSRLFVNGQRKIKGPLGSYISCPGKRSWF